MCQQCRNRHGFTLTEVLIGLIILAIGILAIAGLQATSVRGNIFSNNLMQATYVAQDRLEFLKYLPLDSPELQAGNYNPDPITISGVVFNQSYTVVADGDLRTIHYTVTWNDGITHNVTFSTIRSQ
jgi:prepilin-type N-terminal cleavage/methylation domain-containing protein